MSKLDNKIKYIILFLILKKTCNILQVYFSLEENKETLMFAQDYELERLTNIMQSPLVFNKGFPLSAICFCFVAGFALQAYRGTQKPSPMEVMKTQTTRLSDSPATQAAAPPKMEIPTMESRRQGARPHKLKPRDMNILTPSGF